MHLINYFVYYCVFSPRFVFLRWFSRNCENHAKSMQKGAKRIKRCKGQKPYCQEHVDRLERPEENMSTGLVQAAAAAARTPCARETQRTTPRQSTGSCNLSTGWNTLGKTSRLVLGRKFSAETLAAARTEEPRNSAVWLWKIISPNPEGILQSGQQQSCSQQAKEQIGIKIMEIQRLYLQIS